MSRIRLSDGFHDMAHDGGPMGSVRSRTTPQLPEDDIGAETPRRARRANAVAALSEGAHGMVDVVVHGSRGQIPRALMK